MIMTAKGKRVKKVPPAPPATREEMEALVGEIAALTITRDEHTNEMDSRILDIRQEYEAVLAENRLVLDEKMERARLWAEMNPEAFGAKKSIDMVHAVVGFRTGMPRLKTLRGVTWNLVLEMLSKRRLTDYIRTKSEVDKDRLIADREALADKLPAIGVEVVQDQAFFVEPKREDPER
jgi:phage host-nuclease inhibitor protein Gam